MQAYASAMSSIVTLDWPSVSDGLALSVEVIPIFFAASMTFWVPKAICSRTKPVLDDTAKARAMLRVP